MKRVRGVNMRNRPQLEDIRNKFFEWMDSAVTSATSVKHARSIDMLDSQYHVTTSVGIIDTKIYLYLCVIDCSTKQQILSMEAVYPHGYWWYYTPQCSGRTLPTTWHTDSCVRLPADLVQLISLISAVWVNLNE